MKKFFSLLALILLITFSVASGARLESVTDNAGVLKATEIELLNQKIRNIEQKHKIKIGVAFVKSIGSSDMITASDDLLDDNFSNGKNGGIVLLVDMKNRKYEMSTDRRMLEIITDSNGIPYLKDKFQLLAASMSLWLTTRLTACHMVNVFPAKLILWRRQWLL